MKIINKLPKRFQWTIHNMIAHPIMEILYQLGLDEMSTKIHDCTMPNDQNDNDVDEISN